MATPVLQERIELLRGEELVLANPLRPRLLYIPESGGQVAATLGNGESSRSGDDWSSFLHVLKEHGLTEEEGSSAPALDSLAEGAIADRRHHTLYLVTTDDGGRKLDADLALRKIAEIGDSLAKGATLEVVFFAADGSIGLPLIERVVVRSAHALGGGHRPSGGNDASPNGGKQGGNSPTTNLRLSFRITTDLSDIPDGFAAWASTNDVTVLAEGSKSDLAAIADLSEAGVRVPTRICVADVAPSDLRSLCEACTEANQGAGLVFSREQDGVSGYARDEIASAVLEVQRSHLIPLRRMHPQNDWLTRIELGQGLPWSCGMSTGQVSTFGPDGETGHCPLLGQRPVGSAGVNPSTQDAMTRPLRTATAEAVDNLSECSRCQLRYICGGPCRAAAPGCLFERACIEDLLFEVARTAAGQNH